MSEGATAAEPTVEPFVQGTSSMGALVDLQNVHEVLDAVEGPWRR